MRRLAMVWSVLIVLAMVVLVAVPAAAQEVEVVAADNGALLALTVGDVVAIALGLLGLIAGIVAVVRSWSQGERTVGALDQGIARQIDQQARDREFMESVEKLVDAQNRAWRATLSEVAEVTLKAAQWTPVATDDAAARLLKEAVDGVPLADKASFGQIGDETQ